MTLKPISEQVVVITGASSGIGRETALQFAQNGAAVVVSARDVDGLSSLVEEITDSGGRAFAQPCDVTRFEDVQALATAAVARFGRIDTWVNNAAVALFAPFEDTTPDEFRRVLEVNLIGQVHGAHAALPHLRRAGGGALVCVSSVEAQVSMPLQSAYAASKHGVAGFVDALRRELLHAGTPIAVTSVMPAAINTPLFTSARSKIGTKPQAPPPFYQPRVVAQAILYAASHPVRDIYAGGAARMLTLLQRVSPHLTDLVLASDRFGFASQYTNELRNPDDPGNLFDVTDDDRAEGDFSTRARGSLYTTLRTRPALTALLSAGMLATGAVLWARGGFRAG